MAVPAPNTKTVALEASIVGLAAWPKAGQPALGYGTAGFRDRSELLNHVMYRMGILAAIRSKVLGGRAVGVMITASHNPERDNGVKLVEPMGEMLPVEWEGRATALVNTPDDGLEKAISEIATEVGMDASVRAEVIVGRDTRKSSVPLNLAVCEGAGAMRPSSVRCLGLATTPQLHYAVRCQNTAGGYGTPSLEGYADKLLSSYEGLVKTARSCEKYLPQLTIDCANGVGAVALRPMIPRLRLAGLEVQLRNEGNGPLNEGCGADFVKIKQTGPSGVDIVPGQRFASLDGDADRLVYFFNDGQGFKLLDGDRVALILLHFLALRLREAGITDLRVGLVQTAYANGASTARAVESVGEANVICAKTGVKHCHHAALALDVGAYFEANGHGCILFGEKFVTQVSSVAAGEGAEAAAARELLLFRDLINEAVGDAIAGVLGVEVVLNLLDMSCSEWLGMYTDLPSRQIKVAVKDRSSFETTNVERTCVKPDGLQAEIDKLVEAAPRGRAFVRPSGTEDVVRVYAEAETLEAMLTLARAVVNLVYDTAGGVGERPVVA